MTEWKRKWKRDGLWMSPQFEMRCLACKDPNATFERRSAIAKDFSLFVDDPHERTSYALDQEYNCSECGWCILYGVAIDKSHYEVLFEDTRESGQMETYNGRKGFRTQF